jgi:hypothetical protein
MALYTDQAVDEILKSLGYPDPMMAARQQGRMVLYGRLSRYQAAMQQLAHKWGKSLAEMQQQYEQEGAEDFSADDDYAEWRWYDEAVQRIEAQLAALEAN